VSQIRKLIAAIRNNPKNVRFDDACKVAEYLGFVHKSGTATSHRAFARPGERTLLNFQMIAGGMAKPYQVKQLIDMIDKYEGTE